MGQAIHTRKGESVRQTMSKVKQKLGTVTDLVWIMAMKKLKLKQQCIRNSHSKLHRIKCLRHVHTVLTNRLEYQRLCKLYNQLIDEHEMLELDVSLLLRHTFDPSRLDDSAHRLTRNVSNWLLDKTFSNGRLLKVVKKT